jgi:hypothetical protein
MREAEVEITHEGGRDIIRVDGVVEAFARVFVHYWSEGREVVGLHTVLGRQLIRRKNARRPIFGEITLSRPVVDTPTRLDDCDGRD